MNFDYGVSIFFFEHVDVQKFFFFSFSICEVLLDTIWGLKKIHIFPKVVHCSFQLHS
jgi:hypothetical protein